MTLPEPLPASEALNRVLESAVSLSTQKVALERASGRVLAQEIRADRDLPPFSRVAMDGFAVRSGDLRNGKGTLRIAGTLASGEEWPGEVIPGSTIRVMTGAPLPRGTDAVVQVEKSKVSENGAEVFLEETSVAEALNVHPRGVDAKADDVLLHPGDIIGPGQISVLASVGAWKVKVRKPVRVTILSTGLEIVPADKIPLPYQIRDSNSPTLKAFLSENAWLSVKQLGIVTDELEETKKGLEGALGLSDVVLITGGVSAGAFDHVPRAMEEVGIQKVFHKVAIRPGMPLWFGRTPSGKLAFGLPGNPVSVMVTCLEFVLPALRKLAGMKKLDGHRCFATAQARFGKRKHGFTVFHPARLFHDGDHTFCSPVSYHGSGHFLALSYSDGVAVVPPEVDAVEPDETIEFHPWR
ncbi:MAG: molybdopterin molybdotransferase MoeA [Candidatus Eiseniibacteriota bacterium]|nr:MAG: molybdopterin molybdotransferase MoeA [Candidatus Eisenbacteria bacterium]